MTTDKLNDIQVQERERLHKGHLSDTEINNNNNNNEKSHGVYKLEWKYQLTIGRFMMTCT